MKKEYEIVCTKKFSTLESRELITDVGYIESNSSKKIVCEACEKIFSSWDDYGNNFFCKRLNTKQEILKHNNEKLCIILKNFDYDKLKLFLLSILWRGAVCTHPFFDQIKLGSFESGLKKMILNSDPGLAQDYGCTISKFNSGEGDILHPPLKIKFINNINGYKIFFFNAEAFVKVDQRSLKGCKSLILSPNQPLIIPYGDPPDFIQQLNKARA
ncbi:MAG: hypothetical protein CMF49_08535 [Legionellales bacterium]|nr:hypothetical protein [Legionellales bacterium]|tara:strand:+ start:1017 stop:1658 length:642 start_codon:yes stop_codon:yes gene_type:complete